MTVQCPASAKVCCIFFYLECYLLVACSVLVAESLFRSLPLATGKGVSMPCADAYGLFHLHEMEDSGPYRWRKS